MSDITFGQITYAVDQGIATITLNRPEKLNAFTARMGEEMAEAFRRADEDDAVRAVIVTGAGRGFCSGADISAGASAFDVNAPESSFNRTMRKEDGFVMRMFRCRKPIIGAINGPAAGVGLTMMMPFDFRIASSVARFGFVFTRRGLVLEAGSAWFLPRIVGLTQALEWCYAGEVIDADEALRGKLVSQVVAPEDLIAAARSYAHRLTAKSAPVAIALTRQMLWRLPWGPDPMAAMMIDEPLNRNLGAMGDVEEGVSAFIEKREARFSGKPSNGMPPPYPWW